MSVQFFIFMLFLIIGLSILSHVVASYAQRNGLSYAPIFVLGLITSPVIQFIVVLIMSSNAQKNHSDYANVAHNSRTCPFCAEEIKIEAVVCRFCNRDVPTYAPAKIETVEPDIKVTNPNLCRKCGLQFQKNITICPDCNLDLEIA